jgi:hypothetical protein
MRGEYFGEFCISGDVMSYQKSEKLSQEILLEKPAVAITSLRFEYFQYNMDAFGVGTACPRVSWIVEAAGANWRQAAYEMELYDAVGVVRGCTGVYRRNSLFSWRGRLSRFIRANESRFACVCGEPMGSLLNGAVWQRLRWDCSILTIGARSL